MYKNLQQSGGVAPGGIKYEADQSHADIIVSKMGFNESSISVVSPGDEK